MHIPFKFSVSNFAWNPKDKDFGDKQIACLLKDYSISGIEVAPFKIFDSGSSMAELKDTAQEYRKFWNDQGIQISALQGIFYGLPVKRIFSEPRELFLATERMKKIFGLAQELGTKTIIWGSPQHRSNLNFQELEVAKDWLREIAKLSLKEGCAFCIEPLPPSYGCHWITNFQEGIELLNEMKEPGLKINLDSGALYAADSLSTAISLLKKPEFFSTIQNVQLSAPSGGPLHAEQNIPHENLLITLQKYSYENWVGIEIQNPGSPLEFQLRSTFDYLKKWIVPS